MSDYGDINVFWVSIASGDWSETKTHDYETKVLRADRVTEVLKQARDAMFESWDFNEKPEMKKAYNDICNLLEETK